MLPVTFSAGVTAYQPGEEKRALMKRADTAVYKAKHAGKNQAIFTAAAPQLVQEVLQEVLQEAMREALAA
jgi:predicted signal transduction protein with EAL and GGDEF domain